MKKKSFRGIPAPFHVAVVFALFFGLMGSPVPKGGNSYGGLRVIVAKLQSIFLDDSQGTKSDGGIKKGGNKFWIFSGDGSFDPPPPPPPPK